MYRVPGTNIEVFLEHIENILAEVDKNKNNS